MRTNTQCLGKVSITVDQYYHSFNKEYDRLTIVQERGTGICYMSRKPVPTGVFLSNREYWIKFSTNTSIDSDAIAEINDMLDDLMRNKLDISELDNLATKDELDKKLDASKITDYITKDELKDELNKLSFDNLATKDDLKTKIDTETFDAAVERLMNLIKEKQDKLDVSIFATVNQLANYATISELNTKANKKDIIDDYNLLKNTPTKLSHFENDLLIQYENDNGEIECKPCGNSVDRTLLYLQNTKVDKTVLTTEIESLKKLISSIEGGSEAIDLTEIKTKILELENKKINYADILDKPDILNYQSDWNDDNPNSPKYIANKPEIPNVVIPEQVQADWKETDDTNYGYIKNKPDIDTIVSTLTNTITKLSNDVTALTNLCNKLNDKYIALKRVVTYECVKSAYIDEIVCGDNEQIGAIETIDNRTIYIYTPMKMDKIEIPEDETNDSSDDNTNDDDIQNN